QRLAHRLGPLWVVEDPDQAPWLRQPSWRCSELKRQLHPKLDVARRIGRRNRAEPAAGDGSSRRLEIHVVEGVEEVGAHPQVHPALLPEIEEAGDGEIVNLHARAFYVAGPGRAPRALRGGGESRGVEPAVGTGVRQNTGAADVVGYASSKQRAARDRVVEAALQVDDGAELP